VRIGLGNYCVFSSEIAFKIRLNNASDTPTDTDDMRWFRSKNNLLSVGLP